MFREWQFWGGTLTLGAVALFAGLGGRWQADSSYADETNWVVGVGGGLMILGLTGIIYCALVGRKSKSRLPGASVHVESREQRGGITAYNVNVENRETGDGKEG